MLHPYYTALRHGPSRLVGARSVSALVARCVRLCASITFLLLLSGWLSPALAGQVKLAWDATTTHTDGTPATDLAGYALYWQTSTGVTQRVDVGNQTTYTLTGLTDGTTYTVKVTAYNTAGTESSASNSVTVAIPLAAFTATPTTGPAPLAVQFTDASTGTISTWAWNFGDGTGSTARSPQHTYSSAGTYTASLTVTGPGGSSTKSATITVTTTTPPPAPVAAFTATPTTGPAPLAVQFTDASTGTISTWAWSFGDGTSSTTRSPQHTYSTAGTYTAKLTVTGPGGSATKSATITVTTTTSPPVAAFTATPVIGPAPLLVTFTDTSTGSISTWAWSFGDGTSSTARNPQHKYAAVGSYTVSLTVSGPGGTNTVTKSKAITVTTNPAGLVGAYSFDEGSGTTATDVSGAGNNGTINGATWTTQGKFGGALSFNGTSNWVTAKDAPSLDLTNGMTLEAWVYPTATPTNWSTILMKEQPGEFVYTLYAGSPTNRPSVIINVSTTASGERSASGPSALPLNTWSHLAGTYDGSTLRFYVNGALVTSQVVTRSITSSIGALRIGGNSIWGEYFRGRIDEVRIYNRALSAAEIQADMNAPINFLNYLPPLP